MPKVSHHISDMVRGRLQNFAPYRQVLYQAVVFEAAVARRGFIPWPGTKEIWNLGCRAELSLG